MLNMVERGYPRSGIHGRVVHELGREIVSGVLKQGEKLPNEAEFINRFNGSRTAIREAFRVLSAKGLLEARQRAGTRVRVRAYWNLWDPDILSWHSVSNLDEQVVRQLFELRAMVEPEAARLLAENPSKGVGVSVLEKHCHEMEQAWNEGCASKVKEAQISFHLSLIDNCENEFLVRTREAVQLILRHCQEMRPVQSIDALGTTRWYSLITEKISKGDASAATNAIRSLVISDRERMTQAGKKRLMQKNAVA
ncbi:hypothetical protein A9Q83_01790 [Alphaproteobacteria bacterium 46_93_T64]|nr:hypothetical protein A9Q83_01790 [Alphaproteobacteria bacterium 46_93_T64]